MNWFQRVKKNREFSDQRDLFGGAEGRGTHNERRGEPGVEGQHALDARDLKLDGLPDVDDAEDFASAEPVAKLRGSDQVAVRNRGCHGVPFAALIIASSPSSVLLWRCL